MGNNNESIDKWVLEYLLHKPISDPQFLETLLLLLPIQSPNSRLTKTLLLRRLESHLKSNSVSESALDLIESIQKLNWVDGKSPSEAMKAAYCAVAVECTVRHLGEVVEKNREYFEIVKRVWRGRVGKGGEFVGEEMVRVREEIEDAVWDEAVCVRLRKRRMERKEGDDGLGKVREYLKEAWEEMGPPVLKVVVEEIEAMKRKEAGCEGSGSGMNVRGEEKVDETRRNEAGSKEMGPSVLMVVEEKVDEILRTETGSEGSGCAEKVDEMRREVAETEGLRSGENTCREIIVRCSSAVKCGNDGVDGVREGLGTEEVVDGGRDGRVIGEGWRNGIVDKIAEVNKETKSGRIKLREKHTICPGDRRGRRVPSRSVGVTITNAGADQMDEDIPMGIPNGTPGTPKFHAVREALKCSSMNLQKVVEDPLPNVLQAAEEISIRIKQEHHVEDAACANENVTVVRTSQNGRLSFGAEGSVAEQDNRRMRNRVSIVHDMDDFKYHGSSTSHPHLSTPKSGNVSPLDFSDLVSAEKFTRRRKRKMWTPLEEDALRVGVDKFGAGNWKMIFNAYREVLKDRTDVDLKDKWRNLTKHEKWQSCGS